MPEFEIFRGNKQNVLKHFRHDNTLLVFFILLAIVIGAFVAAVIMFYTNQQNSNVIRDGQFVRFRDNAVFTVVNDNIC